MAKRKLNHCDFYVDYCRYDLWEKYKHEVLDAMLDRGMKLEVCHHSIGYFFPADEAHDYGNYGDSTYYATHPEWFQSNQARIEIPEVREIITKRFLDYVRNNPELKMIGVWPGDSEMPAPEEGLTVADGYLDFWNKIAAELEKEYSRFCGTGLSRFSGKKVKCQCLLRTFSIILHIKANVIKIKRISK